MAFVPHKLSEVRREKCPSRTKLASQFAIGTNPHIFHILCKNVFAKWNRQSFVRIPPHCADRRLHSACRCRGTPPNRQRLCAFPAASIAGLGAAVPRRISVARTPQRKRQAVRITLVRRGPVPVTLTFLHRGHSPEM